MSILIVTPRHATQNAQSIRGRFHECVVCRRRRQAVERREILKACGTLALVHKNLPPYWLFYSLTYIHSEIHATRNCRRQTRELASATARNVCCLLRGYRELTRKQYKWGKYLDKLRTAMLSFLISGGTRQWLNAVEKIIRNFKLSQWCRCITVPADLLDEMILIVVHTQYIKVYRVILRSVLNSATGYVILLLFGAT